MTHGIYTSKRRYVAMLKSLMTIAVLVTFFVGLPDAQAQKASEIYIPIGQSPGLSGQYTEVGKIDVANDQDQTITMTNSSGSYTVEITESTKIWLDRSKLQLTNQKGTFDDLQAGQTVEVKHIDNDSGGPVEWVKVQVTE
jgi:hypothetical protein